MKGIKRLFCITLAAAIAGCCIWVKATGESTATAGAPKLEAKSAILMEETTGRVLYEMNADEKMPPASITKIMTLLLTMEAMEAGKFKLTDMVVCSDHASSMGGAQIWLEPGEKMSVDDLLKAVAIKSANDAAVLLAELVGGSEEGFVDMMNQRARELGMKNTTFKNASGLDADGHITTARDIAAMSRALLKHPKIFEYTKVWQSSLRGGKTELVNTNKLIRFYKGATGLKTGTTDGAGSCLSATATRDGLSLIAVVMGCTTSDIRNANTKKLLDYGFANWKMVKPETPEIAPQIKVLGGIKTSVPVKADPPSAILVQKGEEKELQQKVTLAPDVEAPVQAGQIVGKVTIFVKDNKVGEYPIKTVSGVEQMTWIKAFTILLNALFKMK